MPVFDFAQEEKENDGADEGDDHAFVVHEPILPPETGFLEAHIDDEGSQQDGDKQNGQQLEGENKDNGAPP